MGKFSSVRITRSAYMSSCSIAFGTVWLDWSIPRAWLRIWQISAQVSPVSTKSASLTADFYIHQPTIVQRGPEENEL